LDNLKREVFLRFRAIHKVGPNLLILKLELSNQVREGSSKAYKSLMPILRNPFLDLNFLRLVYDLPSEELPFFISKLFRVYSFHEVETVGESVTLEQ